MRAVQHVIEGFVDELLSAIHRAASEELARAQKAPAAARAVSRRRARTASSATPRPRAAKVAKRIPTSTRKCEEEITNPELLLASAELHADKEPASGFRELSPRSRRDDDNAAPKVAEPRVVMREGESIVRVSSAGMVVRRAKRA